MLAFVRILNQRKYHFLQKQQASLNNRRKIFDFSRHAPNIFVDQNHLLQKQYAQPPHPILLGGGSKQGSTLISEHMWIGLCLIIVAACTGFLIYLFQNFKELMFL